MAIFVGNRGNFRLSRTSADTISVNVVPDDVALSLNRVGFDAAGSELLTGDQVDIYTSDARGLAFLANGAWDVGIRQPQGTFFVNVNAVGGVRFFSDFTSAVNNTRANEKPVAEFSGDPIAIEVTVKNSVYRTLGRIQSYRFSTDREAIDTTSLAQGFREQHNGLITGSGSLDLLFDYRQASGETDREVPLVLFQTLTRLRLGSTFDAMLYVREPNYSLGEGGADSIFYEFNAQITRAGIDASADRLVQASVDFVTTGEFYLKVGELNSYILKEEGGYINLERNLGRLLQESSD